MSVITNNNAQKEQKQDRYQVISRTVTGSQEMYGWSVK